MKNTFSCHYVLADAIDNCNSSRNGYRFIPEAVAIGKTEKKDTLTIW